MIKVYETMFNSILKNTSLLLQICAVIASDESRHEIAYTKIVDELYKRDPNGAMLAFADMMKKQIVMPAHLMNDLEHSPKNDNRNLFQDYSDVAQRLGVYTVNDYLSIMEHLISRYELSACCTREGNVITTETYSRTALMLLSDWSCTPTME